MAFLTTLSLRHVVGVKSTLSKALAAFQPPPHAETELYQAVEATASLQMFDGPSACTQELNRAAEQLRLAATLTSTGDKPTMYLAAAATAAAYHWVWVVATVATSYPKLIGQQEREGAALALNLLFQTLPVQLADCYAEISSTIGEPDKPAPEHVSEGKAATLVAIAAAGAAAVGLLELQDWVREGVVPVDLPTDTPNLVLLSGVLAVAAAVITRAERDSAHGLWVLEEGVLPFLQYATQQPWPADVMEETMGGFFEYDIGLQALVQYCERAIPTVLGMSTDPWLSPKLEPLILALGMLGTWPGASEGDIVEELEATSGNPNKLAMAALELLEKLWASAGKGSERAERLAWVARAARAAGALCLTCLRGQQEVAAEQGSCGELMAAFGAGIPPAALVAVTAMEQLAAWAAAGTEEQGLRQSTQRHGLQQATRQQFMVLLTSCRYLGDKQLDVACMFMTEAQHREDVARIPPFAGMPAAASILEALARLTGFLAQQRQQGGLKALGLALDAESLGLESENDLDSGVFRELTELECMFFAAVMFDGLPGRFQSPLQQLAQLPEPAQLQSLAYALAARANVLLANKTPPPCGPILDWKYCAHRVAASIASTSMLVLKRSRLDGGSEKDHLRDYSAVAWVLAPVAAALLRLAAEEGHGRGAEHLVEAMANLASAGLGDMVARCGGAAVLHLAFQVPEHDVPQRTKALATLVPACNNSPGLCVSFGREGFLEKLVGTAAAFGASRLGAVVTRSEHLRERVRLLAAACGTLDKQLGTEFLSTLRAVDGVELCMKQRKLSPQLNHRLKQCQLWDEVKAAVVDPLTQRCRELYEAACQQEETCALRDLAVGRWAGVGCCNPGCCSTGGWGCERKLRTCAGCRVAKFCSQECQKQDWARHKPACRALAQRGSS